MAEIRNVLKNGGEVRDLTDGKVADRSLPAVQKSGTRDAAATGKQVGGPSDADRTGTEVKKGQQVKTDAVFGKGSSQFEAAKLLSGLGGASATEKLLGLDLRPTMAGALIAPPGNTDFIRHLSPTMRRTLMRNMLERQRKRMRRLARFLRDEREQHGHDHDAPDESFLETVNGPAETDETNLARAIAELGKSARMLDVLDELLSMQDYTISQIGTYSQG